ncbi:C-terminal binding protein [Chloroflexota bacterium]
MSFKVVITHAVPGKDYGEKLLESVDASLVKGMWLTEDEIISNAGDADAVLGRIAGQPFTRRVIEQLARCRIIAGIGVGYEATDIEAATEHGTVVTNVPDFCIDEVSGRAIAMMLALAYKIIPINEAVKEKNLNMVSNLQGMLEVAYPVFRTRNQILGIVGLANIGTATALKARGMGMKVITYDPYVPEGVIESVGVKPVDFDTLLRESDFISLHTPLTPQTKNMFGYDEFKKMKHTAYFINTARGGCVDEAALIRALREKLIAGAGLDVTVDEPITTDNPLTQMPNVILTGHSSWYSTAAEAELFFRPMTQVIMALQGKWPTYAVNRDVRREWLKKWGEALR